MISEENKVLFCLGKRVNLQNLSLINNHIIMDYSIQIDNPETIRYHGIDLFVNGYTFLSGIIFEFGHYCFVTEKHHEVWSEVLPEQLRIIIQEYVDFIRSDEGREILKRINNLELYQ